MVLHEVEPSSRPLRLDHVPENQMSWSERPSSADMEQVRELLDLIKGVKMNDGLVVASFIVCCV